MNRNVVGWFEIPVTNLDRAVKFYETVFDIKLSRNQFGTLEMAWFPMEDEKPGTAGSLVCMPENYTPSSDGVLVYFTSQGGNLTTELSKVEQAGGKVLMPKKQISEDHGYMGLFLDTEGNRIAVHSRN